MKHLSEIVGSVIAATEFKHATTSTTMTKMQDKKVQHSKYAEKKELEQTWTFAIFRFERKEQISFLSKPFVSLWNMVEVTLVALANVGILYMLFDCERMKCECTALCGQEYTHVAI